MSGFSSGRFLKTVFGFVAAGMIGLMTPAAEARDVGSLGGGGGGEFRSTCNPGNILIGFNMNSGSALDSIAPICIPATPEGEWTGTAYEAPKTGGGGGSYQKIACTPGYAVSHLHVFMDNNKAVNHIIISCKRLISGDYEDHVPGQIGGRSIGDVRIACGAGEVGTGIYGRSGALVDHLGLQCEKMAFTVPAAAPPAVSEAEKQKAQQERAAAIAEERRIEGKTVEQCQYSQQSCHNRCDREIGYPASVSCYASECDPFAAQCMQNAARDIAAQQPGPGETKTATANDDVDVHAGPDGDSDRIGVMNEDDTAEPLEFNADGWCKLKGVAEDGSDGWVAVDHLSNCL